MTVASILGNKGHDVITAQPHRTLLEAAKLLAERKIGALLITGADGSLKGILSERDIVRAIAKAGPGAMEDAVSLHMTTKVVTCTEGDLISQVMAQMTKGRFRHLPVMQADQLVGMISIGDVVKQRIAETEAESRSLMEYIQMAS